MSNQYQITLLNGDRPTVLFQASDTLSIFRNALRAGIEMSAGCMQGRCQICRAKLVAGTVKSLRPLSKYATVDPAAMPDGSVLPCSVVACSDVSLAPRGPWRILPSNVVAGINNRATPGCTLLDEQAMPVWD